VGRADGGAAARRDASGVTTIGEPRTDSRPAQALEAARAFGVVSGGPFVLDLAAAASAVAIVRAMRARRRPAPAALAGLAALAAYLRVARPWLQREAGEVTIDAPPEAVWPWVAQIGQDRGGFYSYEWLENLAGCDMRNADRIHPEWQERSVGEGVPLHPRVRLPVSTWEPGRALGLQGWGTWLLEPLPGGRTRLVVRPDARGPGAIGYALLMELPHLIMQRRMLDGIKERAERRQHPGRRLEHAQVVHPGQPLGGSERA
jgi:Polyketide cyclase / dehydrase and lipid transport